MALPESERNIKSALDALEALENGYYDTHDLDFIEENEEEYREIIDNSFDEFIKTKEDEN